MEAPELVNWRAHLEEQGSKLAQEMVKEVDPTRRAELEARERLFDAFFTTRSHGMGIGLAVVAAVKAARSGAGQGVDYRGVEVFAAYRPVTGTEWIVVAKLDRSEVMAPLRQLSSWVSLIALVALAVGREALGLLF
mgnify:CR=1 FL=1